MQIDASNPPHGRSFASVFTSIWWLKTLVLPYYFLINTRISGTVGKNTPSKEPPHAFSP